MDKKEERIENPNIENENSYHKKRSFFIIHYDKMFVLIETIMSFLIIGVSFGMILFGFQFSFEDPIKDVKNNFLIFQLICIVVSSIATIIFSFLAKGKEVLIKGLLLIGMLSIALMVIQMGIKLFLDRIYQEEAFANFYDNYVQEENTNRYSDEIVIGLSGIKVLDTKQAYIEKSINAYINFKIQTILYIMLYTVVIVIIFYLVYRTYNRERKKARILVNDTILFKKEDVKKTI